MELISVVALGILGVIGAASSKLMADEFKAWVPTMINHLVGWAINSLPEDKRERYAEEWRSDIDETPGEIGKLIVGLGLPLAARRINAEMRNVEASPEVEEFIEAIRDLGRFREDQRAGYAMPNAEAEAIEAKRDQRWMPAMLAMPNAKAEAIEAVEKRDFVCASKILCDLLEEIRLAGDGGE